jgi:hypothetical protein
LPIKKTRLGTWVANNMFKNNPPRFHFSLDQQEGKIGFAIDFGYVSDLVVFLL